MAVTTEEFRARLENLLLRLATITISPEAEKSSMLSEAGPDAGFVAIELLVGLHRVLSSTSRYKVLVVSQRVGPITQRVSVFEFRTKFAALEAVSFFEKVGDCRATWLLDEGK